ncbi:uncharacterized protein [Blastocystis hominis]|uniref:C2 domain-containing protein n=1 Tax=Blastocystis hominis TaxID=12968 RepID=D8M729_BLAHO|nr:uncharacterized protein [Blastocystis hominis]CBK23868.2 unnamed protein product [Blastocystis hominis]|eukprot:XP_012897916.1 uncharacterized protein [Blastocystis hominis]
MGCIQSTPEVSYGSYSTNYVYLSDGTEESLEMYKANIGNSSKVCLSFSCFNLPKMDLLSDTDAFIVVYEKQKTGWVEIDRTEVLVNNNNPVFVKRIILNYVFETVQELKFAVYDADEHLTAEQVLSITYYY